jgi:hypothetical protein
MEICIPYMREETFRLGSSKWLVNPGLAHV